MSKGINSTKYFLFLSTWVYLVLSMDLEGRVLESKGNVFIPRQSLTEILLILKTASSITCKCY